MCRVWICTEDSYTGRGRWDYKAIDACLADQVNALNAAGRLTRSACCGHGKGDGAIILHDATRIPVNPVAKNRVKCKACGQDIHIDHFAGIVRTKQGPALVCDKPKCLKWVAKNVTKEEEVR